VSLDFNSALVLLGAVLIVAAALSGWLRGTVLSISVLAVAAGVGLTLTDVLDVQPGDPGLLEVIELALLVTLFADGLIVERELVRWQWGKPARALILAMPITAGLLALGARVLFPELSWAECLLLGAVLAPTDPVVTSTIVTARRVPALVRHTLNIESGLNDGLALPLVLVLLVFVSPGGEVGTEASKQVLETVVGAAVGLGLALGAGRVLDRLPGGHLAERYEGV
jgi:NhaP-type Na+/H+ or K+/H+ antiporter